MNFGLKIKKIFNRYGYDIKKYHNVYDHVLQKLDIQTILDIGANTGSYSQDIAKHFPRAKIYAFEPLADCLKELKMVAEKNPLIVPVPYALGSKNENAVIQRSSFHPSSSLLRMNDLHKELYPKSSRQTEETIRVKRLDDWATNINMKKELFIKMDVQGFEKEVISGGTSTIKQASALIIENSYVAFYEKQQLAAAIIMMMHELGFHYFGAAHMHYNMKTNLPIYEDSFFINEHTAHSLLN